MNTRLRAVFLLLFGNCYRSEGVQLETFSFFPPVRRGVCGSALNAIWAGLQPTLDAILPENTQKWCGAATGTNGSVGGREQE